MARGPSVIRAARRAPRAHMELFFHALMAELDAATVHGVRVHVTLACRPPKGPSRIADPMPSGVLSVPLVQVALE